MTRPSTIKRLPPQLRTAVDDALKRGCTIDEITSMLAGLGANVSRSAVGRYTQEYREFADRHRDIASFAQAFGHEFGTADDKQSRLLVQLMTSIATRAAIPLATGEDAEMISGKELSALARAVKDIVGAAMIDTSREAKIREEEGKKARRAAAEAATAEGRKAGASPETIERVRKVILGIT
jgi:hypothetical protein